MAVRALTCDNCGWGSKSEECVICGKWPARNPALLCNWCESNRDTCCVCGKWPARNPAMVCDDHAGRCVKCGNQL